MNELLFPLVVDFKGNYFIAYFEDNNIYYDAKGDRIGHINSFKSMTRLDVVLERLDDE